MREVVETFGERRDVTPDSFLYTLVETPEGQSYRPALDERFKRQ